MTKPAATSAPSSGYPGAHGRSLPPRPSTSATASSTPSCTSSSRRVTMWLGTARHYPQPEVEIEALRRVGCGGPRWPPRWGGALVQLLIPRTRRGAAAAAAGLVALALGVAVLSLAPGAERLPAGGRAVPWIGIALAWG